jgi:hypothetical protein
LFRPVKKGDRVGNSRLTAKSAAGIIKTYARRLGLNEADFSGHSLRSGFLTSAARRGASVFKMRDVRPGIHPVRGRRARGPPRLRSVLPGPPQLRSVPG